MRVRRKTIWNAVQYNKRGDHPREYVWSISVPIIGELEGEENRFPNTGRLGTLNECDPADLRYAVKANGQYLELRLGWWILECEGKVVAVASPDEFAKNFEVM